MKMFMGMLALCFVLFQGQGQAIDPCGNYTELNDVKRSTNYTLPDGGEPLSDNTLDPGWFRFTSEAGGELPEICPERFQCGTIVPVWMNGSHPTVVNEVVSRKACVAYLGNPTLTCCDDTIDVEVKKCVGFFVYYLQPTDSCPIAYCAGSREPCPAGQSSLDGFPPCKEVYPLNQTNPTFAGPITSQQAFHFTCTVDYANNDPDLRFEVQWTFDDRTRAGIPNVLLTDQDDREAVLLGTKLKGNLGHLLRCRVRAWYANRVVEQKSPWRSSTEAYYVGFRVEPGQVEMTNSKRDAKVSVTTTVPILCNHGLYNHCCILLHVDVDGQRDKLTVSKCKYKLCTNDWNPSTQTATKEIALETNKNPTVGSSTLVLSFEKLKTSAGGGAYLFVFSDHIILSQVSVTVKPSPPLKCEWTGDPHITGFSGNYFHLYSPGDYTMYNNDGDNFKIQSRNYVCGTVACQCGLIITEQYDVIHINNCGHIGHAPAIEVNRPLREGTVIERSNDGRTIMVYLPSGRQVKLYVWGYYTNTYLTVHAMDNGKGICGTPDGLPGNEYTHGNGKIDGDLCRNNRGCVPNEFLESWRVSGQDNLFNVAPSTNPTPDQSARYCQCDELAKVIDCPLRAAQHNPRCSNCNQVNVEDHVTVEGQGVLRPRRKRDAEADLADMDESEPPHNASQPSAGVSWNQTWPTTSGITEAEALQRCESAIQSSQLYVHCSSNTNMTAINVNNCMLDILYTDSYDIVEASVAAFTDGCQFELMQDINNYDIDDQGNPVLKSVVADVCSTNCLRHGSCEFGACVCNQGYTGSSCQLIAGELPRLLRIRGSTVCDGNQQSCLKIFMDAEGFENSEHFKCKVQEVLTNGSESTTVLNQRAHFITDAILACPLPDAEVKSDRSVKTWSVSFTYDGSTYSNALNVTVFDSTCQDCDDTGCQQKAQTCLINNLCYRDRDVNPDDATKTCSTSHSTSQWSVVTMPSRSSCLSSLSSFFLFVFSTIVTLAHKM